MKDTSMTEEILLYIEEHLYHELTLEKIAKELHYSKFYMARTFKEHTGLTLYQYIRGRRLDQAARMLTERKKSIAEIALEVNYSSQQAFTKAFRGTYGCTPQEYRRIGVYMPGQDQIFLCVKRDDIQGRMAA